MSSSTSSHTILITVKQAGLDQVNTAVNGFAKTSQTATKSTDALGVSWNKASTGAVKFSKNTTAVSKGFTLLGKGATTATKSTTGYTTASGKASTATDKLSKGIGAGGRGLAFGFIGLGSAVAEAVGMYGMYSDAASKVSDAQQRVNELTAAGVTSGSAYTNATNDLADAQRGLNFILRNTVLSFTDIATFVLLAVNALANMRNISQSTATSTQALTTATQALAAAQTASTGATTAAETAVTAYRTATEGAAAGVQQFGESFGTLGTRLTDTNGALVTVGTSTTTLNTAFAEGLTATENLYTSTGQLVTGVTDLATETENYIPILSGSGNQSLLGGITAVDDIMIKNDKTMKAHRLSLVGLAQGVKALPAAFVSAGKSIVSFFTNFGTNITKMGGWLKTAGLAVADFGKKMLIAFITNPIGLAIIGITAAIAALATNFMGFRDAVNGVGVAIGNAIPQLKGVLGWLGEMGNAALDTISGLLGVSQEVEKSGGLAAEAAKKFQVFEAELGTFNALANPITVLNTRIQETVAAVKAGNLTVSSAISLWGDWNEYVKQIAKNHGLDTAELDKLEQQIIENLGGINNYNTGLKEGEKVETEFGAALDKIFLLLAKGTGYYTTFTSLLAQKNAEEEKGITIDKQLEAQISAVQFALKDENLALGENAKKLEETAQKVAIYLKDNAGFDASNRVLIASLLEEADALEVMGTNIAFASDNTIDMTQTVMNMVAANKDLDTWSKQVWGTMAQQIFEVGTKYLPTIQPQIDILKGKFPALGEAVQALYDDWQEGIVIVNDQIYIQNEAEAQTAEEVDNTRQKIEDKAKAIGVLTDIQGLSNEQSEILIDLEEEAQSAKNATIEALKNEAYQRGAGAKVLEMSTAQLRDHIMENYKEVDVAEEVANKYVLLIAQRQDDATAMEIERQVNEKLVQSMTDMYDTTGMTADGLEDLVSVLDQTANAQGIATDEVVLWRAELDRNQAIQDATLEQLMEYATAHGILIPKEIAKDIEKTKEYIEAVEGIGPAVQKAAEAARDAFTDMANEATSQLDGILSDKLGEDGDEIKKVIKGIEKADLALESLTAQQYLISIYLEDTNWENDLMSLEDTMRETYGRMSDFTREEAYLIGDLWIATIDEQIGEKAPDTVQTMRNVWESIKSDPTIQQSGEFAGDALLTALKEKLQDPAVLKAAIDSGIIDPLTGGFTEGFGKMAGLTESQLQSINDQIFDSQGIFHESGYGLAESGAEGYESGSYLFATAGEKSKYEFMKMYDTAGAEAYAKAHDIAESTAEGYESGAYLFATAGEKAKYEFMKIYDTAGAEAYAKGHDISDQTAKGVESGKSLVQNATLVAIYDPITQSIKMVPADSKEALAPMEGIFSNAFMVASAAATDKLAGLLVQVRTSMGTMAVSVQYGMDMIMQSLEGNSIVWQAWANGITMMLPALDNLIIAFAEQSVVAKLVLIDTQLLTNSENWGLWSLAISDMIVALDSIWITFVDTSIVGKLMYIDTQLLTNSENWGIWSLAITDTLTALDDLWIAFVDTSIVERLVLIDSQLLTNSESWGAWSLAITDMIAALDDLWIAFVDISLVEKLTLIVDTLNTNITEGWEPWVKYITEAITTLSEAFTGFYNTVIKIFEEMDTACKEWADNTVSNFESVQTAGSTLQTAMTGLYNTWNTIMDAMSTKVASFASACETAFGKVGTSADDARSKVEALQKAIDALKDKTVTITYKQVTTGSKPKGARFGGSIVGYAQHGAAWIQNTPKNIGGMNVSEFSKPELITATPLSNPYDVTDRTINIPTPNLQIPSTAGSGLGGRGGGGQPITVTGDLHITNVMPNGEVLSKEIKPYLLRGFSGIT